MSRGKRIKGIRRDSKVTIMVNGQPVQAYEGETLHAVLIILGIWALKASRINHDPRGVLCGMGVCHECLVTINGKSGQRSCMTLVEDGMEVRTYGS